MSKRRRERRSRALKAAKAEVRRLTGVILFQGPVYQPQPVVDPCPFCGSGPPWVSLRGPTPTLRPTRHVYAVRCARCGIDGPWSTSPASAVSGPAGWNRRAEVKP